MSNLMKGDSVIKYVAWTLGIGRNIAANMQWSDFNFETDTWKVFPLQLAFIKHRLKSMGHMIYSVDKTSHSNVTGMVCRYRTELIVALVFKKG